MPVDVTPSIRPLVARILSEGRVEAAYADLILSLLDGTAVEGDVQRAITLLPALACAAHGGDPGQAAPACAAWLLLRLAAKLLDDVEDRDLDRDQPLHVNASIGLLELAHRCVGALADEGVPQTRAARIDAELSRAILRSGGGQHRDLVATESGKNLDPDGWLVIAALKSGIPLGWAAWAGAAIAGARGSRLEGYRRYGECLGVLLQIADDYNGVWAPEADAGVQHDAPPAGAPNLALAYARLVADDAVHERLGRDLRAARQGDGDAVTAVREALIDLGAQTFLLAAGRAQYRLAAEALEMACAPPAFERRFVALLDGVMPALRAICVS